MLYLPWFETYGLSYEQTMLLPFDEWRYMLDALKKRVQEPPDKPNELADVSKLLKELLIRMAPRRNQK